MGMIISFRFSLCSCCDSLDVSVSISSIVSSVVSSVLQSFGHRSAVSMSEHFPSPQTGMSSISPVSISSWAEENAMLKMSIITNVMYLILCFFETLIYKNLCVYHDYTPIAKTINIL